MAIDRSSSNDFGRPLRRLLLAVIVLVLAGIFLLWRIDSPRVERFRAQITDRFVPNLEWAMAPVTGTVNLFRDFQSYQRLTVQNQELRSELRKMQTWKEAALQLEQENARLLDLNKVRLGPAPDPYYRRGAGRLGLALPAIGVAERRCAGWHRRWLGDRGRHRACGPYLWCGGKHRAGDPGDRHLKPDTSRNPAVGAAGDYRGRQFSRTAD